MEPVERSKLQPAVSDDLEPLGSNSNVFEEIGEDFDELNEPVYEDIDNKQMSGLEYRVEEIYDKLSEVQKTVEANQRLQVRYLQKISESITFSLEPVNAALSALATRMTLIEDKIERLVAVGVAIQSGTEPIMPVKKSLPETTIVNQIISTPLSGDLVEEIMNGRFGRA